MRRIVLLGATGYTGRLVAEALVRARARPILAGRSGQNLAALGVLLGKGLDTQVADALDPESLLRLVQPDDVVVNTVGPFTKYGANVVEAAIEKRATYIDSAGEPGFLRTVFEKYGPVAEQAEVALVPAAAFEYTSGHLAASLALDGLGESAQRVDVGYFLIGNLRRAGSAGTKASAGFIATELHYAWRGGELVTVPPADQIRTFAVNGTERPTVAFGGTEHLTLPKTFPWLRDVGVYFGASRSYTVTSLTRRFAGFAHKMPGLPETVRWFARLPHNKPGPDATERKKYGTVVIATAYDDQNHELRTVTLTGGNPYEFSGVFLAWAAMRAATIGIDGKGALGPIEAFGPKPLRSGAKSAGLELVT